MKKKIKIKTQDDEEENKLISFEGDFYLKQLAKEYDPKLEREKKKIVMTLLIKIVSITGGIIPKDIFSVEDNGDITLTKKYLTKNDFSFINIYSMKLDVQDLIDKKKKELRKKSATLNLTKENIIELKKYISKIKKEHKERVDDCVAKILNLFSEKTYKSQLIKNHIFVSSEKTWVKKMKEMMNSIGLKMKYSKEKNTYYFF